MAFGYGRGHADRVMMATGSLDGINSALDTLKYIAEKDFNSRQHAEVLMIAIQQTGAAEAKVRYKAMLQIHLIPR